MRKAIFAAVAVLIVASAAPSLAAKGGGTKSPSTTLRPGNFLCDAALQEDPGSTCSDIGPVATLVGTSVDNARKSNALTLTEGDYVGFDRYYDMPAQQASFKFSFLDVDGVLAGSGPRISVYTLDPNSDPNLESSYRLLYLDPAHCATTANGRGWATADFTLAGPTCSIYDSEGNVYTGNAATNTDPQTSAWSEAVGDDTLYWSFLILDQNNPTLVDRLTVGSTVFTDF
jgi:hypothetical protein